MVDVVPSHIDVDVGIHVDMKNETLIFKITPLDYQNLKQAIIHNSGYQLEPSQDDILSIIMLTVGGRLNEIEKNEQIQLGNYHIMLLITDDVEQDLFKVDT